MKIKQLGNGGAFNYNKTNSSFLIQYDDTKGLLLFDCGYNVFTKLMELGDEIISNITGIFISHMDDDHIGSLKTLLYYRYFMLGKHTHVFCGDEVFPYLDEYLEDINKQFDNGNFVDCRICFLTTEYPYPGVKYLPGEHHTPVYGIKITNKYNQCIMISGDTKATNTFRRELKNIEGTRSVIFHDYSEWNNEPKQVHACKEDFELFYHGYLEKITKYHNNSDFNEEWIDLSYI